MFYVLIQTQVRFPPVCLLNHGFHDEANPSADIPMCLNL